MSRLFHLFSVLVAILNLLLFSVHATPTPHASQLSPLSDDFSPRTLSLPDAALTHTPHPKRATITRGTFYRGLWSLAITATTFLIQGPSTATVPAADLENFAQQVLNEVASNIVTRVAEKPAFGWVLDGVSITFGSYMDRRTGNIPTVPWAVVHDFVTKIVLWRAQRGLVAAFTGNIWGPQGECVTVVLKVAATGAVSAANSILDSASEIHGG